MIKNILFILIILLIFSCEKDNDTNDIPEWSKITALRNGVEWETNCVAYINETFHQDSFCISAYVRNEFGSLSESLSISNIPIEPGKYSINASLDHSVLNAHYVTLLGDDLMESSYHVLEGPESFIEVEIFDPVEEKLSGNFEITFVLDTLFLIINPNLPDTIVFSNGVFNAKIRE